MGWYLKKSFAFGPLRLNLSKSGIGASAGVKGMRVSKGPKGTLLNAGREGLYYRKSLNPPPELPFPNREMGGTDSEAPNVAGSERKDGLARFLGGILRGILGGFMRGGR